MKVELIDKPEQIAPAAERIARHNLIGIDTEFDNNRLRYGMNLCVLQIATPDDTAYIIDPLSLPGKDGKPDFELLRPIWDLVAASDIRKVLFSGSEDLLIFARHCRPANIYDLSLAVRVMGLPYNSFSDLAAGRLGLTLDKASQRADWYVRPLTPRLLEYLVNDVAYLCRLHDLLDAELERCGRRAWLEEETELLLANVPPGGERRADLNDYAENKFKVQLFPDFKRFVVKELLYMRERYARQFDVPEYMVMSNERLLELAEALQGIEEQAYPDWSAFTRGVHRRLGQDARADYMARLRDILKRGEELSRTENSHRPRPRTGNYVDKQDLQAFFDFFEPIQKALAERYGEGVQQLLISKALLKRAFSARSFDVLKRYALPEIERAASDLGLDYKALLPKN